MAIEVRSIKVEGDEDMLRVESRATEEGSEEKQQWIVGYAAKFGVDSLDMGDFVERLDPGAFDLVRERRGRKKPLETRALWNHDANYPLARYPQTLQMSVDEVGLRYEFPVPDTTYGKDIASNIANGIVRGSSFSFVIAKDGEQWSMEEGRSIRTVTKIAELYDVGPVTYPAYPDSGVAVAKRSYDQFREQRAEECEKRKAWQAKIGEHREWLEKHGEIG
jgi:HK97 family phage prohead protease